MAISTKAISSSAYVRMIKKFNDFQKIPIQNIAAMSSVAPGLSVCLFVCLFTRGPQGPRG
jgi:hypothetical protein